MSESSREIDISREAKQLSALELLCAMEQSKQALLDELIAWWPHSFDSAEQHRMMNAISLGFRLGMPSGMDLASFREEAYEELIFLKEIGGFNDAWFDEDAEDPVDEMNRLGRELADSAARSDIECHCMFEDHSGENGGRWFDTATDYDYEDTREWVEKAVRYLELRRLLKRHPVRKTLVQVIV